MVESGKSWAGGSYSSNAAAFLSRPGWFTRSLPTLGTTLGILRCLCLVEEGSCTTETGRTRRGIEDTVGQRVPCCIRRCRRVGRPALACVIETSYQ